MAEQYWLVKQEPGSYSWQTFVKERGTDWTGVRNFQARNHLRSMKAGDLVLFYHSGDAKEVVGVAKVKKEAYPDPTADEGDWSAVDFVPVKGLKKPVTLQTIKGDRALKDMPILRHTRLSVSPVTAAQFKRILELGETELS